MAMLIFAALVILMTSQPTVHAYKFAVLTSPTLGNFRDLSGLINGLLNFRHEVYLVAPDDNRTHPELSGYPRLQRINYLTSNENPYEDEKRYKLIYNQQTSELDQLDQQIRDYECGEAENNLQEIADKIKKNEIHMIIVDAGTHHCYYQVALATGLPYASLANKAEPYLMQTHVLSKDPCYLQQSNALLTRINAFWSYLKTPSSPALDSCLWLWNTNGIVDCPGPSASNVLEVGALSHKEEKALPEELDKMFDDAYKYGVIVFSLPGVEHSPEFVDKFMEAFEQLDQIVVWRTDANVERKIPRNVLMTSLIPDNDLLAHVNVKLMITEADNARQLDSLFHSIPMLNVILTPKQTYFAKRAEIKGYGWTLPLSFTPNDLVVMVDEAINNPPLREKAEKAGALLKGSPDYRYIAVYWLDIIARHGSEHFKPVQFNTLQYYMIDVILVVSLTTFLTIYFNTMCVKFMVEVIIERRHNRAKSVQITEPVKTKPKLDGSETKPKDQKPTERKQEQMTEAQQAADKTTSGLQHQGSKKHKKKKNK